jgi:hypothetical protein
MLTDGLPSDPYALAKVAAAAILERFDIAQLDVVFVLGSGWSAATDDLGQSIGSCELAELPGFTTPTVIGHGRRAPHRLDFRGQDRGDLHRTHPPL